MKSLKYRILLTLAVIGLGLYFLAPTIPGWGEAMGKLAPDDGITLGLDLRGGIHLTLGVDMDVAVENNLSRVGDELKSYAAEEKNIIVLRPTVIDGQRLEVILLDGTKRDDFDQVLSDKFNEYFIVDSVADADNGKVRYVLSMQPDYRKYVEKNTMDQAITTIRNRVDQFGVAEPDIRKQEGNRIQIQLPGLQDADRAIAIIGRTAHLEFKIVDDAVSPEQAANGVLPPGREVVPLVSTQPDGSTTESSIVVFRKVEMTGEFISNAKVSFDQFGSPYVTVTFDARGSRLFSRVTGENVNKRMAIILDGKAHSAPVIREQISGGNAAISGSFTTDEAHDLAIVLRAGSLPAPVNILEQRAVGPSLGQESIDKGINAAILGLILVLGFMVVYYGFSGAIADAVLVLNIVLILAGLAAFGATLTMPGIAGIILTIGMAVDANVIIFERIREELRLGLTAARAIEEGYSRATLTILDANVTTVIAAIILYQFGTGPIRGFAVTLTLGIITSMFTAIFVSRIVFDLITAKRAPGMKLSI